MTRPLIYILFVVLMVVAVGRACDMEHDAMLRQIPAGVR